MPNESEWTDAQVVAELRTETPLNKARCQFSSWAAKIIQSGMQRKPLGIIEIRRMEFEAVKAIVAAYTGVEKVSIDEARP